MDITKESNETIKEAVNQVNITQNQKEVVIEILNWAKRMKEKYGDIVVSKTGDNYDWGEALCREQFGPDWQHYMISNDITIPTKKDLLRAIEWEKGDEPSWVNSYVKQL